MLKLADNPPIRMPGLESIGAAEGLWWLAHTKARAEKVFAFELLERGIAYFLPMMQRVKISGGRKRHVMLPLFPSYVFFCGSEEARYKAMTTNRLCQVIPIRDQDRIVAELGHLDRALAGKARLDPYPFAAVGQRCRITGGPFEGMEGVVVQRRDTARLVLEVAILGQGAVMEIEAGLLEPAGDVGAAAATSHGMSQGWGLR